MSKKNRYAITFVLIVTLTVSASFPRQVLADNEAILKLLASTDPDRIMSYIDKLVSFNTRESGSYGFNQSLNWVASLINGWGYTVFIEPIYVAKLGVTSYNLIALKQGVSSKIFGFSAHLDSISSRDENTSAPGANDNGSGVACLLEIARIIANCTLEDSVMFFFFSGEEQSFDGSSQWIEEHPENLTQITILMNFDMVGFGKQLEIDWDRDLPVTEDVAKQIDAVRQSYGLPEVVLQAVPRYDPWSASDQKVFWDAGVGAVLIKSRQAPDYDKYHTSQDLPFRV
ncbi:MAG: M28 family metallopeptidase, partial [Candidatus Ranarchaeia archaeon]